VEIKMKILNGMKTYITAALIAAAGWAKFMGYIDEETYQLIIATLIGGSLAAMRAGVTKSGK